MREVKKLISADQAIGQLNNRKNVTETTIFNLERRVMKSQQSRFRRLVREQIRRGKNLQQSLQVSKLKKLGRTPRLDMGKGVSQYTTLDAIPIAKLSGARSLVVTLTRNPDGSVFVQIRQWLKRKNTGESFPTRHGIFIPIDSVPSILDGLSKMLGRYQKKIT